MAKVAYMNAVTPSEKELEAYTNAWRTRETDHELGPGATRESDLAEKCLDNWNPRVERFVSSIVRFMTRAQATEFFTHFKSKEDIFKSLCVQILKDASPLQKENMGAIVALSANPEVFARAVSEYQARLKLYDKKDNAPDHKSRDDSAGDALMAASYKAMDKGARAKVITALQAESEKELISFLHQSAGDTPQ